MTPIRAIFFDNDGILVDTEHLYFQANQRALATVGVNLTREEYVEFFLVKNTGAWHLATAQGVPESEIPAMRSARNDVFSSLLNGDNLVMDGVRDVLDALHGRYTMGIVTSSEWEHFNLIHANTDLLRYFSFILASGDYPRSKPNPDPYLAAVERSGFQADECLVIEDSLRGLTAARAAGLRCIIVPSELTKDSDFAGAHKVLPKFSDVLTEIACLGHDGKRQVAEEFSL